MINIWKIDENGFYIIGSNTRVDESDLTEFDVTVMPNGYYMPKWNGESWDEGATEQEIVELQKTQETKPTIEDRIIALEVLTVNNMSNDIENKILGGQADVL